MLAYWPVGWIILNIDRYHLEFGESISLYDTASSNVSPAYHKHQEDA
jgi:hypothetical protein